MRGKKTTFFVSCLLALSLALTACASDNDDNSDNGGTSDTMVTSTTIP